MLPSPEEFDLIGNAIFDLIQRNTDDDAKEALRALFDQVIAQWVCSRPRRKKKQVEAREGDPIRPSRREFIWMTAPVVELLRGADNPDSDDRTTKAVCKLLRDFIEAWRISKPATSQRESGEQTTWTVWASRAAPVLLTA